MSSIPNTLRVFFNEAIEIAKKSPVKHRHGCVIIYENKIIGKGYNTYRKSGNYLIYKDINGTLTKHAEIMAIFDVCKEIGYKKWKKIASKCTLIVVRLPEKQCENITLDECMNSKPCKECNKKINKDNIGIIYYSET